MQNTAADLETILNELRELRQQLSLGLSVLSGRHLQIEAYLSLHSFIKPRFPFPPMGPAAVAPDMALILASQILQTRPDLILEMGSGVSTVVAGYMLQRNGHGRIISLEHSQGFVAAAAEVVTQHGLDEYVQVIHAPLTALMIGDDSYQWYDRGVLHMLDHRPIDLLFVDGPPGFIGKLARYPALPVLYDYLAQHAIVILDDADREDEKIIASKWSNEYQGFTAVHLPTMRGALIARACSSPGAVSQAPVQQEGIR